MDEKIIQAEGGKVVRRTESMGVVSDETTHPDGRVDVTVTVNTIFAEATPTNYAEKIMVEILEAHGGQMKIDEFKTKFRAEAQRRGVKVE